jgi:hypothetical protein
VCQLTWCASILSTSKAQPGRTEPVVVCHPIWANSQSRVGPDVETLLDCRRSDHLLRG